MSFHLRLDGLRSFALARANGNYFHHFYWLPQLLKLLPMPFLLSAAPICWRLALSSACDHYRLLHSSPKCVKIPHTDKQTLQRIDVLLDLQNSSGHKTPLAERVKLLTVSSDMAALENEFYFYMQERQRERGEQKAF